MHFYRLRFSLRPRELARIWRRPLFSCAAGCPVDVRGCLEVETEERTAAFRGRCEGLSRPSATSTVQRHARCPTSAETSAKASFRADTREVGQVAVALRRLRSSPSSKLLRTGRRRRELRILIPQGCTERKQASQRCTRVKHIAIYEPMRTVEAKTTTDKNSSLPPPPTIPRQLNQP